MARSGFAGPPGALPMLPTAVSREIERQMHEQMRDGAAREQRRREMQGHGAPIVSVEHAGHRLVAVRNRLHWSKSWKTFEDFLFDYIKNALGPEWGTGELKKPEEERHPLLNWYTRLCEFQRANMTGPPGSIHQAHMSGAAKAYLHLAYDLYLIDHNAELQASLVARLKSHDHFEGAVHEAHVVGMFAKAGFDIALEDEADITRSHVEFVATHRDSGRTLAVEAKAFKTTSGKASDLGRPPTIRAKLEDALKKKTAHDRFVVIELARPENLNEDNHPAWLPTLDAEVEQAERDMLVRGKPAPPAYVLVTNRPCVWATNDPALPDFALAYGFKISDFMPRTPFTSILSAVKARRKHEVAEKVFYAVRDFASVPSTFGDDLPEERLAADGAGERPRIGARYLVPSEANEHRTGVVVDALVMESWKQVVLTIRHDDGSGDALYSEAISEEELAVYRASPDTFFGVLRPVPQGIKTPFDAFDFFYRAYRETSRERLLELMANWPEIESVRQMSDEDVLDHYCDRWATHMWLQGQKKSA